MKILANIRKRRSKWIGYSLRMFGGKVAKKFSDEKSLNKTGKSKVNCLGRSERDLRYTKIKRWRQKNLGRMKFGILLKEAKFITKCRANGRKRYNLYIYIYIYIYIYGPMVFRVSRVSVRSLEGRFPDRRFDGISFIFFLDLFLLLVEVSSTSSRNRSRKKMTEMPSKRRSGNRPSKDRTDKRDTRKTIGPFYNRENLRRNIYIRS